MSFQTNPNLPLSFVKPTVAVSIDPNAPAVANADEASIVLLWGEQLSSGIAPFNSVQPLNSLQDAINNYGKRSTVARMLRAALSQKGVSGTVKFFGVGVPEPSGGTAGTGQIVCSVVDATGATATNPLSAGGATIMLGGTELASVSWTTSDTATTIGDALAAALNKLEYAPFGTWTNSTGTVTANFNTKGALSEDYPIRVIYSKPSAQCGVYFGPGALTFATNATGAGSVVVVTGATTISTALAGGETPTQIGDKVVAQFATNDYPLLAGKNNAGVVPIYYSPGHDVRRPNANIGTSTGTTVDFTGGSATDGSGVLSHASTYAGTVGSGYPTLTTAVTNVRASGSFGKHAAPWIDATTASAIFAAIVSDGDGGPTHQKGQKLHLFSNGTEAAAETFIGATSPAMTSTTDNAGMRGAVAIFPDSPHPGYELASRLAALRASSDAFINYDNVEITGTADVPVLLPSQAAQVAFDDGTQNTAIKAGLTPCAVKNGSFIVVFGRNTIATTATELWDWSWIDQADSHRLDVRADAGVTFAGCALIKPGTVPASRNDVDPQAIESFLQAELRKWQAQGTYDGAEALKDQCKAQINPSQPSRADAVYPESPKIPFHTLGIVAQRSSPPSS